MVLNPVRRWIWPLLVGLAALLALLLWLSPAEQTLGQVVKLVYLHGALVRTAMFIFGASLPVNLVALVKGPGGWSAWGKALAWTAIAAWLAHTLFSMVTTYAAWGMFIAWDEPRTRFTFSVAVIAVVIAAVAYMVDHERFSALALAVLAGLTLSLLPRLGIVQHPLDPIGSSSSNAIHAFYAAILVVSLAMGGLFAVWLYARFVSNPQPPVSGR